jgi:hypothetical protein
MCGFGTLRKFSVFQWFIVLISYFSWESVQVKKKASIWTNVERLTKQSEDFGNIQPRRFIKFAEQSHKDGAFHLYLYYLICFNKNKHAIKNLKPFDLLSQFFGSWLKWNTGTPRQNSFANTRLWGCQQSWGGRGNLVCFSGIVSRSAALGGCRVQCTWQSTSLLQSLLSFFLLNASISFTVFFNSREKWQ